MAERKIDWDDDGPRSVLFVVPGRRRLANLRTLCSDLDQDGSWPILATSARELRAGGALGPIWQRLDAGEPGLRLTELPVRRDLGAVDPALALGRCWRHDSEGFWGRLSPLGRATADPREVAEVVEEAHDRAQPCGADVANRPAPTADADRAEMRHPGPDEEGFLARRRAELEEELRADIAAARARRRGRAAADLRLSGIDGFMDDPEPDEEA